jgi:hypothetical protein
VNPENTQSATISARTFAPQATRRRAVKYMKANVPCPRAPSRSL